MTDEEKRIFDKYIRPGRRILSRIKTRLMMAFKSPRVRTIKDVDWMNTQGMMKLFYLIILIALIRSLASFIWDAYLFFFPQARALDPGQYRPYIIPMIARAVRGVTRV